MIVQHNIFAENSFRNLKRNRDKAGKNLEKLSSGYKINRSADDSAGLSISEKMRAQITGLEASLKNVRDGIGLIQTAEGALTEVHAMLNRLYSLSEQSANGTYEDSTDRASLQMEAESICDEINRIGASSNYNGKKLFAPGSDSMYLADREYERESYSTGGTPATLLTSDVTLTVGEGGSDDDMMTLFADEDWRQSETIRDVFTQGKGLINTTVFCSFFNHYPLESLTDWNLYIGTGRMPAEFESGKDLTADTDREFTLNLTTSEDAAKGMNNIRDAITIISAVRGRLGGYQNRLEHTLNNLGVMRENLQDAESSIRDTDVAEEMMQFTKMNILSQANQAMLAQANQQPERVLQMIQGG